MTLTGMRIAVTRPEPGELGERLAALGATVVHVPLIEIGEPLEEFQGVLTGVPRFVGKPTDLTAGKGPDADDD